MSTDKSTSSKTSTCKWCGVNKCQPLASRCRSCQDKVNARQKELRAARTAAGLCKCGREAPREGKADCQLCFSEMSVSQNVTYRKRKLAGLCSCGAEPDKGYKSCSTCRNNWKRKGEVLRRRVFNHYGLKCACCGEETYEFLELDHIDGGGNDHRRSVGATYRWVIRNNFPPGFQTLCSNCNRAKFRYGACPHQKQKKK